MTTRREGETRPFTDSERLALFIEHMERFNRLIAEERHNQGHIVYPEGIAINPSAWPACLPNCEHTKEAQ